MANWYLRSGASGTNAGTSWTNACQNMTQLAATAATGGDTVFIADDHNETTNHTTNVSYFVFAGGPSTPMKFLCVDRTIATPSAEKDLRTGARIKFTATGGNWNANIGTYAYWYGVEWNIGDAAGTVAAWALGAYSSFVTCENCIFKVTQGNTSIGLAFATNIHLIDCIIDFSARNDHYVSFNSGRFLMQGGAFITGSAQTNSPITASGCWQMTFRGVDMRRMTMNGTTEIVGTGQGVYNFEDCLMPNNTSPIFNPTGASWGAEWQVVSVIHSDKSGIPGNYRADRYTHTMVATTDIKVVRTGGSTDGTTPVSHKMVTTSSMGWSFPGYLFPITIFNAVVQSDITVTVEGIASPVSFSALPKNDEVWMDAEYLSQNGQTLGKTNSNRNLTIFTAGTAHAASTVAWDSKATARAQSTAYALGDVLKVASNPGRIFFCTTAGTSTTTEPGGYASAVDGGSVTDGSATFKAGWRFKMVVRLGSPQVQMTGVVTAYPKIGKASATLYIDPKITLS